MLSKLFTHGEVHIKADSNNREFEAYANVKGVVDHALDKAMDGCYTKSVDNHRKNGTAPKMLWSHNPDHLPLGKISHFEEDSKGLFFKGKLSATTMGNDVYELAKDGAIDMFSIGYIEVDSKWNSQASYNELYEVDVKEISWVNFACNEESRLQGIKSAIGNKSLPTERELEKFLRDSGLSKSEAKRIASNYNPSLEEKLDIDSLKGLSLFK